MSLAVDGNDQEVIETINPNDDNNGGGTSGSSGTTTTTKHTLKLIGVHCEVFVIGDEDNSSMEYTKEYNEGTVVQVSCDTDNEIHINDAYRATFVFDNWSDGLAQVHNVTINSDITLTATFARVIPNDKRIASEDYADMIGKDADCYERPRLVVGGKSQYALCTKYRALHLGCKVSGNYLFNQLVPRYALSTIKKPVMINNTGNTINDLLLPAMIRYNAVKFHDPSFNIIQVRDLDNNKLTEICVDVDTPPSGSQGISSIHCDVKVFNNNYFKAGVNVFVGCYTTINIVGATDYSYIILLNNPIGITDDYYVRFFHNGGQKPWFSHYELDELNRPMDFEGYVWTKDNNFNSTIKDVSRYNE